MAKKLTKIIQLFLYNIFYLLFQLLINCILYNFFVLLMSYMIPVWFVFPVATPQFQFHQPANQSLNQSFQLSSPSCSPLEKEKWENYFQIFRAYLEKKCKKLSKKLWTKEEDSLLIDLNSRGFSWDQISQIIAYTNPKICKRRFERINEWLVKWPQQLDKAIKHLVEQQNLNWNKIHEILYSSGSLKFPKHSVKQLKQRYLLNLRPGIVIQEWKIEEDIALLNVIRQRGTHWRKLSLLFAGRTELQLKNRYYGTLKPLQKKVLRKLNSRMKQIRSTNNSSQ